jgi:diphosphomevalonate decarboxylase
MMVIEAIPRWRSEGLPVYFTVDAGPNVHLICEAVYQRHVEGRVRSMPGVLDVLVSGPGGATRLLESR